MTGSGDPVVGTLLERCSFPPSGTEVTCAVSGGADSSALLVLAVAAGCEVTAVHVDHGLRPGSSAEADVVAATAERFGARFRAESVRVEPGPNLEARARTARLGVLPDDVLTGHTADDRAETVLLNLLRGAGPAGLSGISRHRRRPLLDLRRSDTEWVCRHLGVEVVVDPTNFDPTFRRNRIRHELLPLLADVAERDPVPVLVRQADLFADLDEAIEEMAATIEATSAAALRSAPVALAGAAVRRWLRTGGVASGYGLDRDSVNRVLAVAAHEAVATELAGGWRVARTDDRLRLVPPHSAGSAGGPSNQCKDPTHG